jgi:hypothetical protein
MTIELMTHPAAPVMTAFLPSNLPSFLCIFDTSGFAVSRGRNVESYAWIWWSRLVDG